MIDFSTKQREAWRRLNHEERNRAYANDLCVTAARENNQNPIYRDQAPAGFCQAPSRALGVSFTLSHQEGLA